MVPPMVLVVTLTALVVTSLVFMVTAALTRAEKVTIVTSLAGGLVAGGFEIGVDSLASSWGLWHYPGYRSFGPLGFYLAAAIGYAILGLLAWKLRKGRFGWRAIAALFLVLGIYGPIRDRFVGRVTGLFELSSGIRAHLRDAAFIWIIPSVLVWILIELTVRTEASGPRMNRGHSARRPADTAL